MRVNDIVASASRVNEKTAIRWGEQFIKKLDPKDVKWSIENNISLVKIVFNHFHLSHPIIKKIVQPILKYYWENIENFIKNKKRLEQLLSINKELKQVLSSKKGKKWIVMQQKELYDAFYYYTWYNIDPLGVSNPYR